MSSKYNERKGTDREEMDVGNAGERIDGEREIKDKHSGESSGDMVEGLRGHQLEASFPDATVVAAQSPNKAIIRSASTFSEDDQTKAIPTCRASGSHNEYFDCFCVGGEQNAENTKPNVLNLDVSGETKARRKDPPLTQDGKQMRSIPMRTKSERRSQKVSAALTRGRGGKHDRTVATRNAPFFPSKTPHSGLSTLRISPSERWAQKRAGQNPHFMGIRVGGVGSKTGYRRDVPRQNESTAISSTPGETAQQLGPVLSTVPPETVQGTSEDTVLQLNTSSGPRPGAFAVAGPGTADNEIPVPSVDIPFGSIPVASEATDAVSARLAPSEHNRDPDEWPVAFAERIGWGVSFRDRRVQLCFGIFAIVVLGLTIGLGVTMSRDSSGSMESKEQVVNEPTKEQIEIRKLVRDHLPESVAVQDEAVDWLAADPNLSTYTTAKKLERYALDAFYDRSFAHVGASAMTCGILPGWRSYADECKWLGVSCNDEGRVEAIELVNADLTGPFSEELVLLTNLKTLKLNRNSLTGALPDSIGDMLSLEIIQLSNNDLTGTLPASLGNLVFLRELRVDSNQLSGSIPSAIANIQSLRTLWLSVNKFTDGICPFCEVDLDSFQFDCTGISTLLDDCSCFDFCCADGGSWDATNFLVDKVRESRTSTYSALNIFGSPQQKALWWVCGSQFDFSSSSFSLFQQRFALATLYYSTTKDKAEWSFCGEPKSGENTSSYTCSCFDRNIRAKTKTKWLTPPNNAPVPNNASVCDWCGVYCDANGFVSVLELVGNKLAGSIPPEISFLSYLNQLLLFDNQLTGTIPSELGAMTSLKDITLADNFLIGTISTLIGKLTALERFDASRNMYTGTLPTEFGRLTKLKELFVGNNDCSGTIPSEMGLLADMEVLIFENNRFGGEIPDEIYNIQNIQELWFYRNHLTGSISPKVGQLNKIDKLIFSDNKLTGPIPTELGQLTPTHLWLYWNNFSTPVPDEVCVTKENRGADKDILSNLQADCVTELDPDSVYGVCRCCTVCCDTENPGGDNCYACNDGEFCVGYF